MKLIKKLTLLILLASTLHMANAQRRIKEGMVTYTATYDLCPDQVQYADQLPKEVTCYFRGDSCAAIVNQGAAVIKGV